MTVPQFRHWDGHLLCIRWAIRQWEDGWMDDDKTVRLIRAYLADRDEARLVEASP